MSQQQKQQQKQTKQRIKQILPKLKCAFHENQTLTNFCSCKKCLLPLCPSCIKIHTIQHVNMKTDPEYDNLLDVIFILQNDLKSFTNIYQEGYQMFNQVQEKVIQFKQEIWKSIEQLKKTIINQVEIYFKGVTQAAEQKISQMTYIQQLQVYKSQLKKTNNIIKNLQKNLLTSSTSGKHLIRNLIKYHSNGIEQHLQKFDQQSQQFISKLQGNFCTLSIRQNLKQNLMNYLTQIFKININQIPVLNNIINNPNSQQYENGVYKISKKLQIFTNDQKSSQKGQIRNSLTNILSKAIDKNNSNKSIINNNKKLSIDNNMIKDKQNNNIESVINLNDSSSGFKYCFSSNNKRSFTNHSSQRKSLNVSGNFQADMSCIHLGQNNDKNNIDKSYQSIQNNEYNNNNSNNNNNNSNNNSRYERRASTSKGKGLTLIHSNNTLQLPQSKYLRNNNAVRFSLSSIDNVNLDLVNTKPIYMNRRK